MKAPMRMTRILAVAILRVAAASAVATMAVGTVSSLAAATPTPVGPFQIKPPEMGIPAGSKPGALRRIIQPFGPWTLICDENLQTRKRVCNVSQTLLDSGGHTVFSWSLAAKQDGAPVFIVRLPAALAEDHFIQVVFGKKDPLELGVIMSTCDAATCIGFLEVDSKVQRQIAARVDAQLRVRVGPSTMILEAPMDGLKQAVASLKK